MAHKLLWENDLARGPAGRGYMLDTEHVRGEPPAWSVLVTNEGRRQHRRIRPVEPPWPTKARAKAAAQKDADERADAPARFEVRPLRRTMRDQGGGAGVWRSRDGRWTFLRHFSDPHPQRWFAYIDDDDEPANDGMGHVALAAVAAWAEAQDPADYVGGSS